MSLPEIEKDLVYAGVRYIKTPSKKDLVKAVSLHPIENQEGSPSLGSPSLGSDLLIAWSKEWERRIVGAIYRGAKFGIGEEGQTTIRYTSQMTYIGKWEDREMGLQWQALHQAELSEAQKRAELLKREKEGKETFYTDELLLLRGLYQNCRPYTKRAMEEALQIALRTPLTKPEQEKYDAWVESQNRNASNKYLAKRGKK